MRFFGIGPLAMFLGLSPAPCPTPPILKDFDVFYTDDPVVGVDVMANCELDAQCAFYVEQQ